MLDVHPPHESVHTWRDFFIHIATITVGLLIAVGLEQGVEAVHQASERRGLLREIYAEIESNKRVFAHDLEFYRKQSDWETQSAGTLRAAPSDQGAFTVTLPAFPYRPTPPHAPSLAVLAVAKASGKVALLPENLAEVFDRVELQGQQFRLAADRQNASARALANFGVKTGTDPEPGATMRLTSPQRDDLLNLLATDVGEEKGVISWIASWQGASQAVLDGVKERGDLDAYMDTARAAARKTQ